MRGDSQGDYVGVNGLELYYEIHGVGEPVILLHGGIGAIEMFADILSLLAEGRQIIGVDLQAHRHTADIDRPMSFEARFAWGWSRWAPRPLSR
jgi:pimeloyl-ACP methyl ester carboxylesterase